MLDLLMALVLLVSGNVTTQQVQEQVEQILAQITVPIDAQKKPYFKDHTPRPLLVAEHGARWDLPHLWTRGGVIELGEYDAIMEANARLKDPNLQRLARSGGSLDARITMKKWKEIFEGAKKEVAKSGVQCFTAKDIDILRRWVTADGHTLIVTPTPEGGYAHVTGEGDISLPIVDWHPTKWPGRAVVYHEMTHYMQINWCHNEHLVCGLDPENATYEFSAMIVESAEMAREGITGERWAQMDHEKWMIAKLYPDFRNYEAVCPPRMNGSLFHDYVVRYGPVLTGDTVLDLLAIEGWTRRFENLGRFIPADLQSVPADWMDTVRLEQKNGFGDPLVSTCQTYLAMNGCPSAYPIIPLAPHDTPYEEVNLGALFKRMLKLNPLDTNTLKALEFMKRCGH